MMKSMTGYGKAEASFSGLKIVAELKSVNHRFLDISLKYGKQLGFLDVVVRGVLKKKLARGHVDVYIAFEDTRENKTELTINFEAAKKYMQASNELKSAFDLSDGLSVAELMRMPEVVSEKETESDEAVIVGLVEKAVSDACEKLDGMKIAEGKALFEDMGKKLDNIEKLVQQAALRAPQVATEYRQKLKDKMTQILDGVELDEARLLNEVAFFADRAAVDEELTRLNSHMSQFKNIAKIDGTCGKELDFVVQEMNREINTLGSKSNDSELTRIVVDLKSEVEKIREQIQNIE